jgi:hypothetical protein
VEVLIFHGVVAVVTVHNPRSANIVRLRAECKVSIMRGICEIVKETYI